MLNDKKVTFIAHDKGADIEERKENNFGMAHPEGYRKVLRLAKQAEKFNRPIITIIDTAGAYPGIGAEERGQGSAIAECLYELSDLKVPIISILLSEGGSGGALAIAVCDHMLMFENAFYSVISPEGYASILYKDGSKAPEIIDDMKIMPNDLLDMEIIEEIIEEPKQGLTMDNFEYHRQELKNRLCAVLAEKQALKSDKLVKERYNRFRKYGK
jgi:acetyl-CoA carboxylase carboxyl transferase subunit alpha